MYNPTGPRCTIRMMEGVRAGRCLDGESLDPQPGGPVHVFPCTKRWNQFLSFGNGIETPKLVIHTNVPLHTRKRIAETGRKQEPYMCLGVAGRGSSDEEDWLGNREDDDDEESRDSSDEDANDDEDAEHVIDKDTFSLEEDDTIEGEIKEDSFPPLTEWEGKQLIATKCSNSGALIEWLLVPFIVEEDNAPIEDSANIDEETEEL